MNDISTDHLTQGTTSCFLPETNIQFAWDSTSFGYLKTCPRLYQYNMIEGWGSRDESIHLRFGMEYHQSLQEYDTYKSEGADHNEAVRLVLKDLLQRTFGWTVDETTKTGKYKNRNSLIRMVLWYLEHFRDDICKTFIMSNGKPAVELSFRFELSWSPEASSHEVLGEDGLLRNESQPYLLCGHLDRVVSFHDDLFVMDHKTTTTTPGDYFFNSFEPSNQMSLYSLAGKIVLDAPIKGVIITAAQILVDSARFVRGFTFRTQDQLEEWLVDASRWFQLAEWYATNNYWPQNDTACDKFGGCKFREICSKSPSVREIYLKSKFTKLTEEERWNPLRSR